MDVIRCLRGVLLQDDPIESAPPSFGDLLSPPLPRLISLSFDEVLLLLCKLKAALEGLLPSELKCISRM